MKIMLVRAREHYVSEQEVATNPRSKIKVWSSEKAIYVHITNFFCSFRIVSETKRTMLTTLHHFNTSCNRTIDDLYHNKHNCTGVCTL